MLLEYQSRPFKRGADMHMSFSALSTPSCTFVPRAPLSPSTIVSPLVTADNTLFVKAELEERRPIQATLILSRIASKTTLPPSYSERRTRTHSTEMRDYFDRKDDEKRKPSQDDVIDFRAETTRVPLHRASTYVSFPDFEKIHHMRDACERHHELLQVDVC